MVYLSDKQHELLKNKAETEGRSMAELIREAVNDFLIKEPKKDYFAFIGIGKGPKDGRASEQVEELLKESLK
jgi:predicted DNA-binding protein